MAYLALRYGNLDLNNLSVAVNTVSEELSLVFLWLRH